MKFIELKCGTKSIVSDKDYKKVSIFSWHMHGEGYASAWINKEKVLMHRFIKGFPKKEIDHKNRNRLDNRRSNLRTASCSQNQMNKKKIPGLSSKYKGVTLDKSRGMWLAYIKKDGKRMHIGRFHSEIKAAKAYDSRAKRLFNKRALLNFPVGLRMRVDL